MPSISTLPLFILIVQFNNPAFSFIFLQPYDKDVLHQLPPLQFPGSESTGTVLGISQKLSNVQEQTQVLKPFKTAMTVYSSGLGLIPKVGSVLKASSNALVSHIESSFNLAQLRTELKIELAVQEELSKQSLSEFRASVSALKDRLQEILASSTTDQTKRTSVTTALHECKKIWQLFDDQTYMFWKLRLIFFPHLVSFAALYAMVATAARKLFPHPDQELPSLHKNMELLQLTILKYHQVVKSERLSRLTVTNRQGAYRQGRYDRRQTWEIYLTEKFQDVRVYCPFMRVLQLQPPPFKLCMQRSLNDTLDEKLWASEKTVEYYKKEYEDFPLDRLPEWFKDTVTGQIFCGWEGCWNSLHEHYGNQMDKLTTSALELIPSIDSVDRLPEADKKAYTQCDVDGYGRLKDKFVGYQGSRRFDTVFARFGCHKGYCWRRCTWGWCYTKSPSMNTKVPCTKQEDCCREWSCKGICSP